MATTKQIEAVTRSLREQGAGGENIARHVEALLKPEPVTPDFPSDSDEPEQEVV
jgi:hypothetical protein